MNHSLSQHEEYIEHNIVLSLSTYNFNDNTNLKLHVGYSITIWEVYELIYVTTKVNFMMIKSVV